MNASPAPKVTTRGRSQIEGPSLPALGAAFGLGIVVGLASTKAASILTRFALLFALALIAIDFVTTAAACFDKLRRTSGQELKLTVYGVCVFAFPYLNGIPEIAFVMGDQMQAALIAGATLVGLISVGFGGSALLERYSVDTPAGKPSSGKSLPADTPIQALGIPNASQGAPGAIGSNETKYIEMLRTYAWNYFSVHADQRLKTFNFYLVIAAALVGAFVTVAKESEHYRPLGFLLLLLSFLSMVFYRFEQRNRHMVKTGENALKFLDELIVHGGAKNMQPHLVEILRADDVTWRANNWTYHTCIKHTFSVIGIASFVAGIGWFVWGL